MIGNGRHDGKAPNVAASVSELTHNVIELTELQVQLLTLDVKQSVEKARMSLMLAVAGVCLLLGTIPVLLLALAAILMQALGWSAAVSVSLAALVGLLGAGTVLGVAWGYIKNGLVSLQRSRDELQRNIAWLKHTLRTRGQAETAQTAGERPLQY